MQFSSCFSRSAAMTWAWFQLRGHGRKFSHELCAQLFNKGPSLVEILDPPLTIYGHGHMTTYIYCIPLTQSIDTSMLIDMY